MFSCWPLPWNWVFYRRTKSSTNLAAERLGWTQCLLCLSFVLVIEVGIRVENEWMIKHVYFYINWPSQSAVKKFRVHHLYTEVKTKRPKKNGKSNLTHHSNLTRATNEFGAWQLTKNYVIAIRNWLDWIDWLVWDGTFHWRDVAKQLLHLHDNNRTWQHLKHYRHF